MSKLGGGRIRMKREERSPLDYYPTPEIAINKLLDIETIIPDVWECASGDGVISKAMEERGIPVYSSDLNNADWVYGDKSMNFLTATTKFNTIITNPPYSMAEEFIHKGLELSNNKLILLLRLAFLESQKRHRLFIENPPNRVHVFSGRLPFFKDGCWNNAGGQFAHAWYVWDKDEEDRRTILDWVPAF